jgi:beta-lactamase regulating signal transducer with metallopeptidase domain
MNTLLDVALKSIIILAFTSALAFCCRRASAATRHWIWFLGSLALLCLPLLSLIAPPWQKALWQVSTDLRPGNEVTLAIDFSTLEGGTVPDHEPQTLALPRSEGRPYIVSRFDRQWLMLVPFLWFAGGVLVLSHIAVGHFRLHRIRRGARPADVPFFAELCRGLDVGRPVTLLQSVNNIMPMTWGWRRPVVLLPDEASQWSPERLRVVVLHELAHVKRWDCLTQTITRIACALYWFNPLVWLGARRMCVERERACDDLVLNGGCKASDYASHLMEIAQRFRRVPQVAAIAMARPSGLQRRIAAIVDSTRKRNTLAKMTAALIALTIGGFGLLISACSTTKQRATPSWSLERSEVGNQLKRFVAEKEAQAIASAKPEGREILPEYKAMFAAAARGDWHSISNIWENMRARAPQYEGGGPKDDRLHGTAWQTMLEIWGSFGHFALGEERPNVRLGKETIESIPPRSIYFGGTDPGRCVITALQKSHVNAEPFFTITQNALADGTYLEYLRRMYEDKIYIPTDADSQRCFSDYLNDAQKRLKEKKLKPGEDVKVVDNRVQVSGQVAVMSINGLLTRVIFDKNPDHEFYVEESFPLDWMYPYLSPNGLIMKINRQALSELSEDIVRKDREYWNRFIEPFIGDWLRYETPVEQIAKFGAKTYSRQPDPDQYYHSNTYMANKWASKLRSSIAGLYAWRAEQATNEAEKTRMRREADFAFRQAYALCPFSPEAVFRYVNLLVSQKRHSDALLLAETAVKLQPTDQFRNLIKELKRLQAAN